MTKTAPAKRTMGLEMRSFTALVSRLARRRPAGGRNLTAYDDDTFVVSYPKSGNTWVRFLIANLISGGDEISFANIESRIPDIYAHTDRQLRTYRRPRFLKSHEPFDPRYRRVIYLVRDPRAVAASYFFYCRKVGLIGEDTSLSKFVDRFLDGNIDAYGSWEQNVASWLRSFENRPQMLMLRYEDLLADTEPQLRKIAEFLDIDQDPRDLRRANEASRFDRMRALEESQLDHKARLKQGAGAGAGNIPFVRDGTAEGWRAVLSDPDRDRIERTWSVTMRRLGYLPET